MNDPLALLHAETASLNIDLTPDLLGRVMSCFGEGVFARLLDPKAGATAVADVWTTTYNNLDFENAIIACLAVRCVLEAGASQLRPHLGNLRWKATWCHVHLYLAGSLYQRAKELMGSGSGDAVRPMLIEALRCWDVVEPSDDYFAGSKPGRIWRGMRGVTRLVLARQDPAPLTLLHGARVDLRLAEERDDTTAEHFAFHLEVLYRLAQDPAELPALWAEADRLAARARPHVSGSFDWECALGELHLRRAQSAVSSEKEPLFDPTVEPLPGETDVLAPGGQPDVCDGVAARSTAALEAYQEALRHFQQAQDLATGREQGFRLVMLRHNHGVARAGIARTLQALKRTDEARTYYVDALDDLRWSATHDTPVRGSAFPSALIDFALHLYRAKDFAPAHAVSEEAYALCEATPSLLVEARQWFLAELRGACAVRALWPSTEMPSDEIAGSDTASGPDTAEVRTRLDALLAAQPTELLSAVPLVQAAWLLVEQGEPAEDLTRVRAALATLHALRETAPTEARSWLSTRLGMLYGRLDRLCRTAAVPAKDSWGTAESASPAPDLPENLLARAYTYFVDAVEETTERRRSVEFGLGRAALHHAKALLAEKGGSEAVVMLLHEARDVMLKCLDETAEEGTETETDGVVTESAGAGERPFVRERVASYLGETCLRLHALTRDDTHLREAVGWFEEAIAADDPAGNVQGMLGDAYLRVARSGGVHDLRTALGLKARARAAGDRSRENLSVSAAGHYRLWRSTQAPEEFATAVDLALQARALSPDWPWPLLQLADMAGAPATVRTSMPTRPTDEDLASELTAAEDAVRAGDQGALYKQAARTAVHSQPFRQAVLGGRSETFVLDDPHRLLSTTLVLKPTYRAEAEGEQTRLSSLRQYLRETGAPRWMKLPAVLALVDLPSDWSSKRQPPPDTALASRRAVGRSLAGVIADAYEGRNQPPHTMLRYALQYLARIHVWSSGAAEANAAGSVVRPHDAVAAELEKRAAKLLLPDAPRLAKEWAAATPWSLASVPGRDAHAENWMVTDTGEVVALDLEPHYRFPLLYEVVQLIEDHAALSLLDSDWQDREPLCGVYLDELAALGHPDTVAAADVLRAYQAFALVRAVFLMEHLSGGDRSDAPTEPTPSSGSRRWARRRLAHAHALLHHCATTGAEKGLRDLAVRLRCLLPG